MISHAEIVTVLRDEALDDPETGWLSDLGDHSPEWEESNQAIYVGSGGGGTIDLSHLASIVQSFMASAWSEGRSSVGQDMIHPPTGAVEMHQITKNPYRS